MSTTLTTPVKAPAGLGQGPRWAIARALDAPTSTLVVDGTGLGIDVARPVALELLEPLRTEAMASGRTTGAKNVVICGQAGNQLRIQFFQGLSNGTIDPSVEVCLNSSAAALAVARCRWGWCLHPVVEVLLGTRDQFRFTMPTTS
jgi:hypothetical protein